MTASDLVMAVCEQIAGANSNVADDDPAKLLVNARRVARILLPLADEHEIEAVAQAAVAHIHGLGPLQIFLADPLVNEIMVNNGGDVWVERDGATALAGRLDADVALRLIERILNPLGRRLDRLSPIVDARLPDGSRVCAVIPPIAVDGPCLTLRRFGVRRRSLAEFASAEVVAMLDDVVARRCNVVISGATSSGKTSLLNVLASRVRPGERIITLEDTAELQLDTSHVLRLETRPATVDGTAPVTMTDLVRTSLRLRPDRIVVGEIRGREVIDMLQAMNTGHDGSMTTCHANGSDDALRRIESLVVQHAPGWPLPSIRDHICAGIDIVIHLGRLPTGLRRITEILELALPASDGQHRLLVAADRVLGVVERGQE